MQSPSAGSRPGARPGTERVARPLSAQDATILALENEVVAGHMCKVMLLDRPLDLDQLRSSIEGRLDRSPGLCLRLGEIDGQPWWVPARQMDVNAQVVELDGTRAHDDASFRAIVAGVFQQRLDRSRPLWRMDLVPRLPAGGSALIWRIHHALADGITAMRMASAVLWDQNERSTASGPPGKPSRVPGAASQAPHHRLAGLLAAAREAPQPWLRSPFSGHIDARRTVAFATGGLDELRQAARAVDGATINDMVLTIVAGGLRQWLETRHGQFGDIRVKVPVSLHGQPGPAADDREAPGNRDSFFCIDLPLDSADPLKRLTAIRHASRIRKQGHDAQELDTLMRALGHVPRLRQFAEQVLAHPRSFALNVSNVPGPREPVQVLGVPVRALYSLAEIREDHALRVAVISLAGALSFGLVADPTLLPDVDHLAGCMQAEAAALTRTRRAG